MSLNNKLNDWYKAMCCGEAMGIEADEIIELCKLGIWAKTYAIPALLDVSRINYINYFDENDNCVKTEYAEDFANNALNKLPKGALND